MKDKAKIIKNTITVLSVLAIIYMITVYSWGASYTVLSADDFSHGVGLGLYKASLPVHILGSIRYSITTYLTWQGTYFSMFLQALLSPLNGFVLPQLRIVMILNELLIMSSVLFLTDELCHNLPDLRKVLTPVIGAVTLFALFGFQTYHEVFFWYSGSTAYGFPFSVMLLGITFMLRYYRTGDKKCAAYSGVLGFLACGGTLMIAGTGCYFVLLIFLYFSLKDKKIDTIAIRTIVFWIAGALLNTCAPGNFARKSSYNDQGLQVFSSVINSLRICFKNYKRLVKTGYIFEILIVCLLIGIIIGLVSDAENHKSINKRLCLFALISPIASWVACFPATLGYSATDGLNNRCDFVLNSTFILAAVFAAIVFGYEFSKIALKVRYAIIAVLLLLVVITSSIQLSYAPGNKYIEIGTQLHNREIQNYYFTCKEFYDNLAGLQKGSDVVYTMDDMPKPVANTKDIYYYEEPDNPENWMNKAFAQYYGLNSFVIKVQ